MSMVQDLALTNFLFPGVFGFCLLPNQKYTRTPYSREVGKSRNKADILY